MQKVQQKICLLGSDGVGKTSIILRYTKGTFSNSYLATLGVDFYEKEYDLDIKSENGENFVLQAQIWDLASQKIFSNIRSQYLRNTHYGILVVDIQRTGDEYITPWIEDLHTNAGDDVPFIIVLNKIDLVEEWRPIAKQLENDYKVKVVPTSAKTGENINDLFDFVVKELTQQFRM